MKLKCSRNHEYDTSNDLYGHNFLKIKDRCPMVMTYDVMSGTGYCRRILQEVTKK